MKSEIQIKVRGYHLDIFSHVNNARYVEFLEEGRWAALENSNIARDLINSGYVFTVVNINISYLAPALVDEVIVLRTELKKIGNKSITLSQKIFKTIKGSEQETQVIDAEVTFVLVDVKTGKAVQVNDEIRKLFTEG